MRSRGLTTVSPLTASFPRKREPILRATSSWFEGRLRLPPHHEDYGDIELVSVALMVRCEPFASLEPRGRDTMIEQEWVPASAGMTPWVLLAVEDHHVL
ncbi:MAG: hypothetical protein JWR51_1311 [Devosia sp.]|nr:hypothetical protein [Devosia sp.]